MNGIPTGKRCPGYRSGIPSTVSGQWGSLEPPACPDTV